MYYVQSGCFAHKSVFFFSILTFYLMILSNTNLEDNLDEQIS